MNVAPVNSGDPVFSAGLNVASSLNAFSIIAAAIFPLSTLLEYGALLIQFASIPAGAVPPAKFIHVPLTPYHAVFRTCTESTLAAFIVGTCAISMPRGQPTNTEL